MSGIHRGSSFQGFSQKNKKSDAEITKVGILVEDYIKVRKENDSIVIIYSTVPYSLLVENKDTIQVHTNFYERRFTIKN